MSQETSHRNPEQPAARWVTLAQRLLACARMLRDELAGQAADWPISEQEFLALWGCHEASADGISQTELAEWLAASAAQVSGLVERLRCGRLLESRRAESDRRRQLWRLTAEGRAVLARCLGDLAARGEALDRRLGGDTVRALCRWLEQLTASGLASPDLSQRGAA